MQGDKPQPVKTGNTNEPDYVRLSNGVLMPLIGYGTFQLQDADMVKWVSAVIFIMSHLETPMVLELPFCGCGIMMAGLIIIGLMQGDHAMHANFRLNHGQSLSSTMFKSPGG
eukprot:1147112-Pelagomonas_calceolata.AAC.6